jgi:hypothetical protein
MTAAADCHLLFGLLALQNGLTDQVQLVAAFQAWTPDKSRSLADQLVARGDLDADFLMDVEPTHLRGTFAARRLSVHLSTSTRERLRDADFDPAKRQPSREISARTRITVASPQYGR